MPTKTKYTPKITGMTAAQRARLIAGTKKISAKYTPPPKPKQDHSIGGFVGNLIGEGPQIAKGLYAQGKEAAGAVKADVVKGRGIPGAVYYLTPAAHLAAAAGLAPKPKGPWAYKKLPKAEQRGALDVLGETMIKTLPSQFKALADPQAWYEDPGIQLLNLASLGLPAARLGGIAKLSRTIREANPALTLSQANKAAAVESFHPGFMKAQGIEGGIKPRVIKGKYAQAPGRMPSRGPVGRGTQRLWDRGQAAIDARNPNLPFSASKAAAARARKLDEQAVKRANAVRKQAVDEVIRSLTPSKKGRAKQALGLGGKSDPARAAALVAALEGPEGISVADAAKLRVSAKEHILEQDVELRAKQDAVDALRRQADDAKAADPEADTSALDTEIKTKQDALDFDLGRKVPEVVGSSVRDSVLTAMNRSIGPEKANETIKAYDAVARAQSPDNPAAWYAQRIEGATTQKVAEFQPGEGAVQYQRQTERGFHFQVEQTLGDLGARPMQAGQLLSRLQKAGVTPEELRNSGVGTILSADKNAMVSPTELSQSLADYYSRFEPDVQVKQYGITNDGYDPAVPYATRWGPDEYPQLNSREGAPGEYHEMTVRVPGQLDRDGGTTAASHWGSDDVIYHVRYQVFDDEEGNRVMLIDEVQSDWASDYRRAKQRGTAELSPEETAAQRAELEANVQGAAEHANDTQNAYMQAYEEHQALLRDVTPETPGGFDAVAESQRRLDQLDGDRSDARYRLQYHNDQLAEHERWAPRRFPPSPMGPDRYLRNAVRNLMKEADDQDVDKIVISGGTTQALRNGKADLGSEHGVYVEDGFDNGTYGEYVWNQDGKRPGETLTNEEITKLLKDEDLGSFPRQYDETLPKVFRDLFGAETEYLDDVYTGRYSGQPSWDDYSEYAGYVQTVESGMPGTVVHLTDEVMDKARRSQPIYRRNLEGVPQGATEWLADGRARLTMFETANVSTWIHELAHVSLKDLDPGDLTTIETHVAEGRKLADWTDADHESFARQFETYMREGKAHPALQEIFAKITAWMKKLWYQVGDEADRVSPQTADVFDRMLGRRYQNTVVLSDAERSQVLAEIQDLKKALESPDDLEGAGQALAALADDAEKAGIEILRRNAKSPEQEAALLEGLSRRKNAIVEDYRRRGLVGPGEEARGYFPQFSMWEALGQPQVAPSRVAATGSVIGTPRVTSKAVNKNRNRLVRYQTGEVLNDPAAVLYILRARHRILATIRAREDLYAVGEPVEAAKASPGWNPDEYAFIRNPDVQPEKMRHATEAMAALSREDFTRLQQRRMIEHADEIDTTEIKDEMFWSRDSGTPKPDWVESEQNVRVVPMKVAKNRVGDVFAAAPRGRTAAGFGMLNAAARAASIYMPLGGARYITRNWIQNAVILAMTNPSAFGKLFGDSGRALRKRDPQLFDRINEEFGTIQAQALPEFNTRPQGRMQRMERDANRLSGQTGEYLGRAADVPLRTASWRRHAEKYGFTTDADYKRLLDHPELADVRNTIAQRTREDMIDFDSLTPFEKEVLTRYLFIWPFVRGASKWPFMYAREYPGRLAAMSLTANAVNQENVTGPLDEMLKGALGDRTFDMAWLNPAGPMLKNAQALKEFATRNARGELTLKPLVDDTIAPQYKFLLDAMTGNLGNDPEQKFLDTFMPMWTTGAAVKRGPKEFEEFVLKTVGNQTASRSIKRESGQWKGEIDDAVAWVEKNKGVKLKPAAKAEIDRMETAYADWTETSKRAEWAGQTEGSDSLSKQKRAALILEIAHEHYPELYAQIQREAVASTGMGAEEAVASISDDAKLDKFYRAARDAMFGMKTDLISEAKKAGYKP